MAEEIGYHKPRSTTRQNILPSLLFAQIDFGALYNLDVFCYMIWTVLIIEFGRVLLYDLVKLNLEITTLIHLGRIDWFSQVQKCDALLT